MTAIAGGLLGATLVRLSPGFGVDEREMDTRLSTQSQQWVKSQHAGERNVAVFYVHYLSGLARGDFGFSQTLNRPISDLLKERIPLTLTSLAYGAGLGLACGVLLSMLTVLIRSAPLNFLSSGVSGLMLSLPAAVLALLFLWMGSAGRWAIALAVFPHAYRYSKNLLVNARESSHVVAAQARGIAPLRILLAHIVAPVIPQLGALAGMSIIIAFGASIPIEAICDSPGIGQLAWQAALARDLPVLVTITLLVAIFTVTVNALSDLTLAPWSVTDKDNAAIQGAL